MIAMAAAPTDTTTAISGDVVVPRRRGKSKAPNFTYDGPVSVIRLELDVSDARVRRRVERQWAAVFRLRRALQRDAAARCRAYWAAHHERGADPKAAAGAAGVVAQRDRGGGESPYRGQRVDARSPDQGHRSACGRRGVGNRGSASVRRRLWAPAWAAADRARGGSSPASRAGPLAHQGHAGVGNLPAGRHPGRAPARPTGTRSCPPR